MEPRPPGASRPRPCPPPPAPGGSQGAPRGLLKRHALSARGTPQRRLFPGRGRGVDLGGGAERELGAARRRSGAAWASPSRVFVEPRIFLTGEFGWRGWGEGGWKFRILRVDVAEPRVGCGKAGKDRRWGPGRERACGLRRAGRWPSSWPGGIVVPRCSRCTIALEFLGQTTRANVFQTLWALDQLQSFPRKMSKLHTFRCTTRHSFKCESMCTHTT